MGGVVIVLVETRGNQMMRNVVRGVLGIVLTAVATWAANRIVEQFFGPEDGVA